MFMNKGLTMRTGQTHVNRWTDDLLRRIQEGQIDDRPAHVGHVDGLVDHRADLPRQHAVGRGEHDAATLAEEDVHGAGVSGERAFVAATGQEHNQSTDDEQQRQHTQADPESRGEQAADVDEPGVRGHRARGQADREVDPLAPREVVLLDADHAGVIGFGERALAV